MGDSSSSSSMSSTLVVAKSLSSEQDREEAQALREFIKHVDK